MHFQPLFPAPTERPLHIALFASGNGSNLQTLLSAQHFYQERKLPPPFQVRLLFCDRACRAQEIAHRASIPVLYSSFRGFLESRKYKDSRDPAARHAYDEQTVQMLTEFAQDDGAPIDLIYLAGYMRLVSTALLHSFPNRILNVHPADLNHLDGTGKRRYIGMDSVGEALRNREKKTRSSMILVNEEVDGGPLLMSGPWVTYEGALPPSKNDIASHQEKQKQQSDWPISLLTLGLIARQRLGLDRQKRVYLDGHRLGPEGCTVEGFLDDSKDEALETAVRHLLEEGANIHGISRGALCAGL